MKNVVFQKSTLRTAGLAAMGWACALVAEAQSPVREVYQQLDLGNNRTQLRMDPSRVQTAFDSLFILSDSVNFQLNDGVISPRASAVDSTITLAGGSGAAWNTVALGPNASATAFGAKALGSESTASYVDAFAAGRGSTADKWASVAMGAGASATAVDALALGRLSNASGYGATALGANSTASSSASFASGTSSTASNWATIAMGANSEASGSSAMALGVRSNSSGWNSMALGADSKATASHAFAAGQLSTASGPHAWAIGDSTIASGHHALAFGFRSKSYGEHAHAMGYKSLASGSHSNAWGYESVASGAHGYALGYRTQATGWSSLALGQNAIASGAYALALGDSTVASGYNSLALGSYARSTGHNTVAAANNSEARSYYEVQFGTFVDVASLGTADPDSFVPEEALFVIGNGTSDGARSNALVIRKDGVASFSDSLHVDEHVDIDGILNVDSLVTINDSLHVSSNVDIDGNLNVDGTLTVNGQAITPGGGGLAFNIITMDVPAGPVGVPTIFWSDAARSLDPESNFLIGPGVVIVSNSGFYDITATAHMAYSGGVSPGMGGQIYISVNGTANLGCATSGTPSASGRNAIFNFNCKLPLTAGDVVELNSEDYGLGLYSGLSVAGGTITMSRLN